MSAHGKVAILDIDHHHGKGTQDIFYQRRDMLTISIHGHPSFAYPYFSGFANEHGAGSGKGYNFNLPLLEKVDGPSYLANLDRMLRHVVKFRPRFLIVALGVGNAFMSRHLPVNSILRPVVFMCPAGMSYPPHSKFFTGREMTK